MGNPTYYEVLRGDDGMSVDKGMARIIIYVHVVATRVGPVRLAVRSPTHGIKKI